MSTNVTGNSNPQSTLASTSNQEGGPSAAVTRHVLRPALIGTYVTYLSMLVITAGVHFGLDQWKTFGTTVMIGYAGAIFGWLAGFLASPYSTLEEKRLTRVTSWISLLASGYLVGKLEPSIKQIFDTGDLIAKPIYGVRLLNFLINLVCTGITVYQYRLYGKGSPYRGDSPSVEAHSDSEHRG